MPTGAAAYGENRTTEDDSFLLCFGFSHYDLDSTLTMNVSLCRILFKEKIAVGNS